MADGSFITSPADARRIAAFRCGRGAVVETAREPLGQQPVGHPGLYQDTAQVLCRSSRLSTAPSRPGITGRPALRPAALVRTRRHWLSDVQRERRERRINIAHGIAGAVCALVWALTIRQQLQIMVDIAGLLQR